MAFSLLIIGAVLLVAAVRGRQDDLFKLLAGDFTGQKNFTYWVLAILAIGMLGYVPKMKTFSTSFLVLIAIVLLLANSPKTGKGFFAMFMEQISSTSNTGAESNG